MGERTPGEVYLLEKQQKEGGTMDFLGLKARKAKRKKEKAALEKKEKETKERKEFARALGFELSSLPDSRSWEQVVVDRCLMELGGTFHYACERQQKLMERTEREEQGTIRYCHERLLNTAGLLERAKRNFWEAHAAAKKAGFSVREKYSDYLQK